MVELGSQSQIVVHKLMELNTTRNSRTLCTCVCAPLLLLLFLSLVGAGVTFRLGFRTLKMLVEQVDGLACFTTGCAVAVP